MTELRARGQEVSVRISKGQALISEITAVKDYVLRFETTVIQEGYLGRTSNSHDDIFNGITGSMGITHEGDDVVRLAASVVERAKRTRSPNLDQINSMASIRFPNGDKPRILVPDMKFNAFEINASGRDAFINTPISFAADDARVLLV